MGSSSNAAVQAETAQHCVRMDDGSPNQQAANLAPLKALAVIARLHHVAADAHALRHQLGKSASEAIDVDDVLRAAKQLGLKARPSTTGAQRRRSRALPMRA